MGSKFFLTFLLSTITLISAQESSGRQFRRTGIHNGNLVRTVYGNWGVVGQPGNKGPRGAWLHDNNGYIGGWNWIDGNQDGAIDITSELDSTSSSIGFSSPEYGIYNKDGEKEKGTGDDRSIKDEFKKLIHHFGLEYWYSKYFALRAGYYYDQEGKINNPTFGVGLRFAGYGFDFGFTSGEPGHPLTNTMRFSLNMEINSPKQGIQQ